MNLLLWLAEHRIPHWLAKRELSRLMQITASAFGVPAPAEPERDWSGRLKQFALFSKNLVEASSRGGADLADIQHRLYDHARSYGARWRKILRVRGMNEALRAAKILYGAMGIQFKATGPQQIEIGPCFFSRYYTPETCRVIYALDAGIMAGLTGGGKFSFSQRITEGAETCQAQLSAEGQQP